MRKSTIGTAHLSYTIGERCGEQLTALKPLWEIDYMILPSGDCEQEVKNEGIGASSTSPETREVPSRLKRLERLRELSGNTTRYIISIGATSTYQALIFEMGDTYRIVMESPRVGDGLYLLEHADWQEAVGLTKGKAQRAGAKVLRHTHNTTDERIDEKCLDFLTAPERTHDD